MFTWETVAEVVNSSVLLGIADLLVPLPDRVGAQALPGQGAAQEVHEHVSHRLQVVTPRLFWEQRGLHNERSDPYKKSRLTKTNFIIKHWLDIRYYVPHSYTLARGNGWTQYNFDTFMVSKEEKTCVKKNMLVKNVHLDQNYTLISQTCRITLINYEPKIIW